MTYKKNILLLIFCAGIIANNTYSQHSKETLYTIYFNNNEKIIIQNNKDKAYIELEQKDYKKLEELNKALTIFKQQLTKSTPKSPKYNSLQQKIENNKHEQQKIITNKGVIISENNIENIKNNYQKEQEQKKLEEQEHAKIQQEQEALRKKKELEKQKQQEIINSEKPVSTTKTEKLIKNQTPTDSQNSKQNPINQELELKQQQQTKIQKEQEEVKQKLKNQELIKNKTPHLTNQYYDDGPAYVPYSKDSQNPEHNQANKEIKTKSSWMPSTKTTLITLGIGGVSYAGYKFWKWRHNKNKKSYNK